VKRWLRLYSALIPVIFLGSVATEHFMYGLNAKSALQSPAHWATSLGCLTMLVARLHWASQRSRRDPVGRK
jgi:hypothetical protein